MKLIKINIAPIILYICVGAVMLLLSLLPSGYITFVLRTSGISTIIAPFVILAWIAINEFKNKQINK